MDSRKSPPFVRAHPVTGCAASDDIESQRAGPDPPMRLASNHIVRHELGKPLNITETAKMLGCSAWTIRQTLIARGLPHFRFREHGRLTFYANQVIDWIERQQQQQRRPNIIARLRIR